MCALVRENTRPIPQRISAAAFAEDTAVAAAEWAMPQNTDPDQPGYMELANAHITSAVLHRSNTLQGKIVDRRQQESQRVRLLEEVYKTYNERAFAWLKGRISAPVWAAMSGAAGFGKAVYDRDGPLLWEAVHAKYQFGTDGTAGLNDEAIRKIDADLLQFSMGPHESLEDYWVSFDAANRYAVQSVAVRPSP